jgi:hypothetical protein
MSQLPARTGKLQEDLEGSAASLKSPSAKRASVGTLKIIKLFHMTGLASSVCQNPE